MTGSPAIDASLRPMRLARARAGLGRATHWYHRLFHRQRLEGLAVERVLDRSIVVLPGVLNPKLMRTGAYFATELAREPLIEGAEVLDMGTGSGICALIAARRASRVVAVDLNPTAVRCAKINVLLNGLEHKVDVRHGDLFEPVRGCRFDLILFNPPFLRGEPRSDADRAWRSSDVPERFAAGLREHLAPGGSSLLLLSTFGAAGVFLEELARCNLEVAARAQRTYVNERLSLYRVTAGP